MQRVSNVSQELLSKEFIKKYLVSQNLMEVTSGDYQKYYDEMYNNR